MDRYYLRVMNSESFCWINDCDDMSVDFETCVSCAENHLRTPDMKRCYPTPPNCQIINNQGECVLCNNETNDPEQQQYAFLFNSVPVCQEGAIAHCNKYAVKDNLDTF